jgi:uncharacterized protein (UPF0216 family)
MKRHHLELLAQLLDDLDERLRQPLVIEALRSAPGSRRETDAGLLIDTVGFQALRLRQILSG